MKSNEKVIYLSCDWVFVEEIDGQYLLRSINKNINDVLAEPQHVKKYEKRKILKVSFKC